MDIPIDEPDEPPDEPVVQTPPDGWRQGELARQVDNVIEIRDPIQFEFATARILPESIPTLRQVAGLVNGDARIGHLLIEGHASEEGSFAYNYDLSIRRAKAIFEQLIVLGVHPERMSYRGMGEVVPVAMGSDEASLEKNRRVEFEIIKQYDPNETRPSRRPPVLKPDIRLPWNGEDKAVDLPPPLPEPKAKRKDLLEDDGEDEGSAPPPTDETPQQPEPVAPEPSEPAEQPAEAPTDGSTEPAEDTGTPAEDPAKTTPQDGPDPNDPFGGESRPDWPPGGQ